MWQALFTALALMLVIEGIMPFIDPAGLRRACALITQLQDRVLRGVGFACMLAGLVLLYVVH